MKKYTASYSNVRDNFVIINNDEKYKDNDEYYGLYCVVQNIIQRGKPSIPSLYLQDVLGELDFAQNKELYLISEEIPQWNVIKGDDSEVYYPAEHFYYELLPKYLGEFQIVRNLIIPEADFKDVLQKSTVLNGQQVDFFFPQIKTVIEIDGSSHKETNQKQKDGIRDEALKKADITVIRIPTGDIRNESKSFISQIKELKKKVERENIVKNLCTVENCQTYLQVLKYETVIRLEVLLLELLKTGKLSLKEESWNIQFTSVDIEDIDSLLQIAVEDLHLWFSAISQMLKYEISYPELKSSGNNKSIKIDFSLFKRYTDQEKKIANCIFIRNDYYPESDCYKIANADTLQYSFSPKSEEEDDKSLKFILNNLFPDLENFREGQEQIIKNVLMRKDTIGILPTGTGKSLCYQIAAMLQPGVSIVVVPIISLMFDQKESMKRRSINHVNTISSAISGSERETIVNNFREGRYQILWISPERFQNVVFRKTLAEINKKMNFAFAVIDEVHCLSEWGHDFRVSYLALVKTLREYCPEATLLGLTATASQAVLEDLKAEFEVDGEAIKALTNMDRPELNFYRIRVDTEEDKYKELEYIIKKNHKDYTNNDGSIHKSIGLIFCPTVGGKSAGCNNVMQAVSSWDKVRNSSENKEKTSLRLATYHGQLSTKERERTQRCFMNNDYDVLMCTKAFGMGIDHPNVKFTIHTSMPQSIEAFYQEAGRAGRDRDKSVLSNCYILYFPEEKNKEYDKITKEIFDPNTEIKERKELSNKLQGDLSTIMWFWNNNKDTLQEEYERISKILTKLYRGITRLPFNNFSQDKLNALQAIQEALYKLSLLGVVDNWTIDYMTLAEGIVHVAYTGLNENKMKKRLLEYIKKYDPEFQFDIPKKNYKKYYDLAHKEELKPITQLIYILLEWTNENIMNSRLQSTYNMMQWLDPNISDEEFRLRINEFFKFTEESVIYNGIIYHPLDYKNWFELIFLRDDETKHRLDDIITVETAKSRLAGLQRYLESYRYNTGLNFLSGILRLYTHSYKNTEGEWRLDEALQSIKENHDTNQQKEILEETLKLAKLFELEEKDYLSQAIIKYFPECVSEVSEKIQDRYSLSIILEEPANRLSKILEGME